MEFQVVNTVRGLELDWRGDTSFAIDVGPGSTTRVEVRRPTDAEIAIGYDANSVFLVATTELEPPEDVLEVFKALDSDRIPIDHFRGKMPYHPDVLPGGQIKENHLPPMSLMPGGFQEFSRKTEGTLVDLARRTVRILRWRHGLAGPHNPFSYRTMSYFSTAKSEWRQIPHSITASLHMVELLSVEDLNKTEVQSYVLAGEDEPIGHELWREAWDNRTSNPRSSLIMAVAAIEVAIKRYVATVVPGAAWLATNVPTPPIDKMLRHMLPELPRAMPGQTDMVKVPTSLIAHIEKGIKARNKLVHTGNTYSDIREVEKILLSAKDILWLLDYWLGHDWALTHVRAETRGLLSK